jgi:hypothetical protein
VEALEHSRARDLVREMVLDTTALEERLHIEGRVCSMENQLDKLAPKMHCDAEENATRVERLLLASSHLRHSCAAERPRRQRDQSIHRAYI